MVTDTWTYMRDVHLIHMELQTHLHTHTNRWEYISLRLNKLDYTYVKCLATITIGYFIVYFAIVNIEGNWVKNTYNFFETSHGS